MLWLSLTFELWHGVFKSKSEVCVDALFMTSNTVLNVGWSFHGALRCVHEMQTEFEIELSLLIKHKPSRCAWIGSIMLVYIWENYFSEGILEWWSSPNSCPGQLSDWWHRMGYKSIYDGSCRKPVALVTEVSQPKLCLRRNNCIYILSSVLK